MDTIFIPQLTKAPARTISLEFKEIFPDFATLTPVSGQLKVTHQGNYLEVSAQAETIVTLTCDRCLQQYNHRLSIKTSELIWLEEPIDPAMLPLEREVTPEELVESLSPHGYFDPQTWIYEQLYLALPPRHLCDPQCPGIAVSSTETIPEPTFDQRWASLVTLKEYLSN
jgi:uncharacterized protein